MAAGPHGNASERSAERLHQRTKLPTRSRMSGSALRIPQPTGYPRAQCGSSVRFADAMVGYPPCRAGCGTLSTVRRMWLGMLACLLVVAGCGAPREPDHVEAYQAIAGWFYGEQPIPARTFAIDAASTRLPDPSRLVDALRADPRYGHHQIIDATRERLERQGVIKDLAFTDGFLIEFSTALLYDGQVTVRGQIWSSGMSAHAATLTARWTAVGWHLDPPADEAVA